MTYINDKHKEDGHKGISSLRNYLSYNNIYFEGETYLTDYIVKNCTSCAGKNKSKLKREPGKQIITYYPKQRYIMDITELPLELKANTDYLYLFNIIDHFSKYGMSFLIKNKEAKTILNYLKLALECNGYPNEIGSDNGKEFKNELIEDYLKKLNIIYIHGMPYNPHSQGVVERFHKTVKDGLYCFYSDDPKKFDIKESLDIIIKKYNNHKHSTTKYTPNQVFYANNEELFQTVLENIKNYYKNRVKESNNFKVDEKCLLSKKFKIKKKGDDKLVGVLIYDKIKHKNLYGKINVSVMNNYGANYKIKIAKDYKDLNLSKNDLYMVDYKLLTKCSENLWNSLLNKNNKDTKNEIMDNIFDNEISLRKKNLIL